MPNNAQAAVRRAWAVSLLWLGVIALESFLGSTNNTGWLLYPLLKFFDPRISPLHLDQFQFLVRKSGHFLGYGILSLTWYRTWWTTLAARRDPEHMSWRDMLRRWSWLAALLSVLSTVAIAAFDEWHQSFEPGRTPSLHDVALDGLGGMLAQCVFLAISSGWLRARATVVREQVGA